MNAQFTRELKELLNKHNIDNMLGIPDDILSTNIAVYILNLEAMNRNILKHTETKELKKND